MEAEVLPENLILNVLSRLPIKTITQCKCVCKRWRHLISDPYFVDLHLSRSPPCLMLHQYIYYQTGIGSILEMLEVEREADDNRLTLSHIKTLNLHLSALGSRNQIFQLGSVNGLICLRHTADATCIFNPVEEEYMILPEPGLNNSLAISYGFGVSMAGEYKLMRICCSLPSGLLTKVTLQTEVYTLGSDQWRSSGPTPYNIRYPGDLQSGVVVNCHVYWLILAQIYDFDLDTETFQLVRSPLEDAQELKQMLGVLKGGLSLFSWTSLGFNVWMMKEECWYKAIAVVQENLNPVLKSPEWKPVFLIDGSDGTSVLIFWPEGTESLVAYCLNTNTILDLNLPGSYFTVMSTYRPSFVKLQKFGSGRVHSLLYGNDSESVKNRYKSSLKFEQS